LLKNIRVTFFGCIFTSSNKQKARSGQKNNLKTKIMETPLELLEKRLQTLQFLASQRGFSKNKKEAFKMIPQFEKAIEILKQIKK